MVWQCYAPDSRPFNPRTAPSSSSIVQSARTRQGARVGADMCSLRATSARSQPRTLGFHPLEAAALDVQPDGCAVADVTLGQRLVVRLFGKSNAQRRTIVGEFLKKFDVLYVLGVCPHAPAPTP